MAYRHYQSEGFIIASRSSNEASRLFRILTPEFGLISALAQGVRLEKSKLRYQLANFSLVNIELVRGREYWRLVGAERVGLMPSKEQVAFLQKISLILIRLVHGEEASIKIFGDLKRAWGLLEVSDELSTLNFEKPGSWISKVQLEQLEIFLMIRLLADLGYLAKNTETEAVLSTEEFNWPKIKELTANRLRLIKLINASLIESGL